jgi:hypothetical protein
MENLNSKSLKLSDDVKSTIIKANPKQSKSPKYRAKF